MTQALPAAREHAPLETTSDRPDSARRVEAMPPLRRTPIAPAPWRRAASRRPVNAGVARTARKASSAGQSSGGR